jgi:sarcosine oxidase subunit beta
MKQSSDVIIVGGGVTGPLTAVHLKLLGVDRVTLLERHFLGSGQSHRAAGIVRGLVRDEAVSRALVESIDFIETFEDRFGDAIPFHRSGYLLLSEFEQSEVIDETIATAAQAGCEARRIEAYESRQLQTGLRLDDQTLTVYEPGAIHLDPMPAVQAMARVARRLGVSIVEGCETRGILLQGDKLVGVESSTGRFDAPQVLVATSAWGAAQLSQIGVDVPVYPHRAEMAFFQTPSQGRFQLQRIVSDIRSMLYLRPEGGSQMFVGWREGDHVHGIDDLTAADPDDYKQTAHYESLAEMQRRLEMTLPAMADGFVHRTYACIYDYTPDGMPILDRAASVNGLYFALGFSGGGFSLSPWVGRSMAQFIVDQRAPAQLERFDLNRFAENRMFHWANVDSKR